MMCEFIQDGTLKSDIVTNEMLPDLNKIVAAALAGGMDTDISTSSSTPPPKTPLIQNKMDLSPVIDFLEGKNCLTGVSAYHFFISKLLFLMLLLTL